MADDLLDHFQNRSKFQHFKRSHFVDAAALLSKHGFNSWKMLSKIDGTTGKFLREDLSEDGAAAIKLSFTNEVLSHLEEDNPSKFTECVFKKR